MAGARAHLLRQHCEERGRRHSRSCALLPWCCRCLRCSRSSRHGTPYRIFPLARLRSSGRAQEDRSGGPLVEPDRGRGRPTPLPADRWSQCPPWRLAFGRQARTQPSKNPAGYCPDQGTGVACPIGLRVRAERATDEHDEPGGGHAHPASSATADRVAAAATTPRRGLRAIALSDRRISAARNDKAPRCRKTGSFGSEHTLGPAARRGTSVRTARRGQPCGTCAASEGAARLAETWSRVASCRPHVSAPRFPAARFPTAR